MATQILAPADNALSIHFTKEDLNTLQVLTYQLDALENSISNAAELEQTPSLKALQTIAIMVHSDFSEFRNEFERRMHLAYRIGESK